MKKTILYYLRKNDIHIDAACNGLWGCGKCKIKLNPDFPVCENDVNYLSEEEVKEGYRLSCEHYVDEDEVDAVLHEYYENLEEKNKVFEKNDTILSDSFVPEFTHDKISPYFGLALDIGTTTLAMNLISLKNTKILAKVTDINPQVNFGFDVMSRIAYTMENEDGLENLHKSLIWTLNSMIDTLVSKAGINRFEIKELCVSANTCMCHILLGKPIVTLGKFPFKPLFTKSCNLSAVFAGLNLAPDCKLISLPHISGFVGSDIVAGVYACKMYEDSEHENILFIDIGTNGEMLLKAGNKFIATSCAVGPALEGMNISCGMRADKGAIDDFTIDEKGLHCSVIGKKKPEGICGSGVLALVRELLKNEIINKRGAISDKKKFDKDDHRSRIIVYKDDKAYIDIGKGLFFSSKDIRQVQLAKAAILSGIICLTQATGLSFDKIDKVYIAGQFGKYISLDSLFGLSLLPDEFRDKLEYLGNTSLGGAYLSLLDSKALKTMSEFAKKVEFFELSKYVKYDRIFASSLLW